MSEIVWEPELFRFVVWMGICTIVGLGFGFFLAKMY
jgi:hypothetical protein